MLVCVCAFASNWCVVLSFYDLFVHFGSAALQPAIPPTEYRISAICWDMLLDFFVGLVHPGRGSFEGDFLYNILCVCILYCLPEKESRPGPAEPAGDKLKDFMIV